MSKLSDVFEEAKQHLWDGKYSTGGDTYICFAIDSSTNAPYLDKIKAKGIILKRLGNNYSLEGWLRGVGIKQKSLTDLRVQQHRHKWLQLLMEEFK